MDVQTTKKKNTLGRWILSGLFVMAALGIIVIALQSKKEKSTTSESQQDAQTTFQTTDQDDATRATETQTNGSPEAANATTDVGTGMIRVRLSEEVGVSDMYDLSLELPAGWSVQKAPNQSVNIYNPTAPGTTSLEQSQIFMRNFVADRFLTLTTVDIFKETPKIIAGRPAVTYDIQKKPEIRDFGEQPSWRNRRHEVTDIRREDKNPSIFYVFARNPALDKNVFEHIVDSIKMEGAEEAQAQKDLEVRGRSQAFQALQARVTKKPFGIFIDPKTSPVQPERFSGFHTGIDIEFPEEDGKEIAVHAMADGTVVSANRVDGYGGVVAIRNTIHEQSLLMIYGHLNPTSLPQQGAIISKGTQIGTLGKGFSEETDGERRHLHFAIYKGSETNLRGYVPSKRLLASWIDPLPFLETGYVKNAEMQLPLQESQL